MSDTATVKQLSFSDLYLGHPFLSDRFSDVPGANINPLPASPLLRKDLDSLTAICREELHKTPAKTEFKINHDGTAYRVSVMNTFSGTVFILRKIAPVIPSLAELGMPQAYIRHLMTKDLSGLFLISGTPKTGKTTTGCAMIKERLTAYGGVAITTEELVELPLEGTHGPGICYQSSTEGRAFSETFRHVMRWGAKIIMVDEIHDQETAAEVLQASVSGHLVISTMLAENVIQTITKLYALVHEKLAPGGAKALLADGLVGVLHQRLGQGAKKKLETEFLFLKDAPLAKTILRNGKYETLSSTIQQQMASMIAENATAQRIGA